MILITLLFLALSALASADNADLITKLPGLSQMPSYKMYSGYLDVSSTRHFHYWFVESQSDPKNDPVVLWLNGGPGCSSLEGLLSENGPIHVRDDGATLYNNPYSWNKLANVIYLESPAGVGYSYDDNNNYKTGDNEVASNNYQALVKFFAKFPQFLSNEFYVTGESYGGIYVPMLSVKILQSQSSNVKINFKGMAVGNGLASYGGNDDSLVFFAYYHGLVGESLKTKIAMSCCKESAFTRDKCSFSTSQDPQCIQYVGEALNEVYNIGLNTYSLYLDCAGRHSDSYQYAMSNVFRNVTRQLAQFSKKGLLNFALPGVMTVPPCINSTAQHNYLNQASVRDAIHIPKQLDKWTVCSDKVDYNREVNNMAATYNKYFTYPNVRSLIYNGDTDMACNFLGDQWFADSLNRKSLTDHKPWYVNEQVAGFAKAYDRLTFVTIKGAGHMVPQWAPEFAYSMFENFIKNKPFTM